MTPEKILVLTASHLCRNPRVVKEATALGAAGYDVTVLSLSTQPRFETMDRELMRGLPFQRVVIDCLSPHPLRRLVDFYERGATFAARWACTRLGLESARTLGPSAALLRRARSHPADLTIAHTEIPLWAAQYLLRDGRRVAVDLEDWHSEDLLPADRRSRPLRLLRRAESIALNQCAYVSTTSQSLADALTARYRCPPPLVVRNVFPLQPQSRIDRPATTGPARFIWFSQTIGPGRGLELFLAAWALTRQPSHVYLLGDERPDYCRSLLASLPAARRAEVHFIPLVPPDELPMKLAEFDLGLALESTQPLNRDLTITNKLFQYMNAGLALIATPTAGQSEVLHAAPGCGLLLNTSEPAALALQLDTLLADPARLRALQVASRAAAAREFSWEHESPRVLAAVARALASTAPRALATSR